MIKQLKTYFKEKDLDYELFEIEVNGQRHIISNYDVIELIAISSIEEQEKIWSMIARIDFNNGNVNDYLKHLAKCYIMTNYCNE